MKIENVKIYDLEESILASGYPMTTKIEYRPIEEKDLNRATKLTKLTTDTNNNAHGQFLTGIRIAFDVSGTNKWFIEAERYRFLEFVSSQSTMHRICKFDLDNQYNSYVDPRIVAIIKEKVAEYNAFEDSAAKTEKYLEILYSNPSGFTLTARMTTNYRCLRNIYIQRKDHRLPEWREFCRWIETLPYAEEFLIN